MSGSSETRRPKIDMEVNFWTFHGLHKNCKINAPMIRRGWRWFHAAARFVNKTCVKSCPWTTGLGRAVFNDEIPVQYDEDYAEYWTFEEL